MTNLMDLERDLIGSGLREIPMAKDFQQLFPGAKNFVSHFTGEGGPSVWRSEAALHERYTLILEVPVSVDRRKRSVTPTGDWSLNLTEISRIQRLSDGRLMVYYGSHWKITPAQWAEMKQNAGEIRALPLIKDKPVPLFRDSWNNDVENAAAAWRKGR